MPSAQEYSSFNPPFLISLPLPKLRIRNALNKLKNEKKDFQDFLSKYLTNQSISLEKLAELLPDLSSMLQFDLEDAMPFLTRDQPGHQIDLDYDHLSVEEAMGLIKQAVADISAKNYEPSINGSHSDIQDLSPSPAKIFDSSPPISKRNTSKPLLDLIQTIDDKEVLNTLFSIRSDGKIEVGKFKEVAQELVEQLPSIFGENKKAAQQFCSFFERPAKMKDEPENLWRLRNFLKNQQKFLTGRDIIAIFQGVMVKKEEWNEPEQSSQLEGNLNKIGCFVEENKEAIRNIWEKETPLSPDGKLSIMDFMSFLRDAFMVDDLKIFESKTGKEDFFTKINSYKRFIKLAEEYVHKHIKIDPLCFSFKDYLVDSEEVWYFVRWWLRKDQELIVSYDRFEPVDVREDLKKTLKHFEDKLKTIKNKVEAEIISKTIFVLKEKLEEFEKSTEKSTRINDSTRLETKMMTESDKGIKDKALKETFGFFCKQQVFIGRSEKTFDRVNFENSHMNQGNFISFCNSFKIKNREFGLKVVFIPFLESYLIPMSLFSS